MTTFLDSSYSLIAPDIHPDTPSLQDLRNALEKGSDESKVETMKRILTIMLNGDPLPSLLMHIIRFVMPSKSKQLKKLLYLYYEVCPKLDAQGKLKQEMILVCNGIRMDLQHANEYIRGNTLRFLCKLREAELIEPLLAPARACLEHRHSYVRKNAVWAVASIYQHNESLLPDAPELLQAFLEGESDGTCKRNAFAALLSISHEKALEYLSGVFEGIPNAAELLQLVELEFIRKDALQNAGNKARYLRLIFDLLEAKDSTVVYEAASSLTALTSNPVAVKAAAAKFVELAIKESDNNVKLIVLEKVNTLRLSHPGILDDLTMEILRVLSSPDLSVRQKALDLGMEMVTSRNVEEVVMLLKKELGKTVDEGSYEKNNEYRSLLIHALHQSAIRHPDIAENVVGLLMDAISDFNNASAVDVISFVKEVVEKFPKMRSGIVRRLVGTLGEGRGNGKVVRGVLWVVGEYSTEERDIQEAWKAIRGSLGEVPIVASEARALEGEQDGAEESAPATNGHAKEKTGSKRVLADGTYATESALTSTNNTQAKKDGAEKPPLRQLILDGDYFLATVLASTLTKLVMRHSEISSDAARTNALRAEAMLIMISVVRVGQSSFVKAAIDEDSVDRIMSCVRSLAEFAKRKELEGAFLEDTRRAFRDMVQVEEKKRREKEDVQKAEKAIQVDDVLNLRQLAKKDGASIEGGEVEDLELAIQGSGVEGEGSLGGKLKRVVQLTGFSDPVYAEAYVQVHQFDIILDVLLVNQTPNTLQNLSVEFATLGDLKVVERPITQNLGGMDFLNVQATIKVSSTDTGVIFGNVVYDGASSLDSEVVILNDVHVDIMDYIVPASCSEAAFRTMWTEFEWENKVNISTKMVAGAEGGTGLRDFLRRLGKVTNMRCLTPEAGLGGECRFLSANLYARSVFGEDALANLSVEQEADGLVTGFMRIRSRSQGLALSLGSLKGLGKVGEMVS
ncbi:coatomer subunit beta [Elasticomyces elasticus]|uniref:Coatomer subunit beta n=1 Tax=Elasticomyces elasticus TaxID=574655 RepID=A0AAN7VMX3_9PEZI|nr:coatomer subunit beta [Elasticomyces elasticus]